MVTNNQFRNRQQHGKVTHIGRSGKAHMEKLNKLSRTIPLVFTGNKYTHTIPYIFARAHTLKCLLLRGGELEWKTVIMRTRWMNGLIQPERDLTHQ